VADKFGRFLHDRRQIFVGRFYWHTKLANFIFRLTSALHFGAFCIQWHSVFELPEDWTTALFTHTPQKLHTKYSTLHTKTRNLTLST